MDYRARDILGRVAPLGFFFIALAALAAVVLIRWWGTQETRLAERWREELEAADVEDMPGLAERLAALGDEGIAALAKSLAAERPEVVQVAAATLARQLAAWELAEDEQAARSARALAAGLAEAIADGSADARAEAAGLAHRLLLLKVDLSPADRVTFIADCERVLLAAEEISSPAARVASAVREPLVDRAPRPKAVPRAVEVTPAAVPELVAPEPISSEPRLFLDGHLEDTPGAALPSDELPSDGADGRRD